MSLYRRSKGGNWWIDTTLATGERVRQSTCTKDKKLALEFYDELKADSWKTVKLDVTPDYLWQEAVTQWMADKKGKSSIEKDKMICRGVRKYLDDVKLKDINRKLLKKITDDKAKETSEATANRHMDLIRAILRKAVDEWDMLDKAPKVPMFSCDTKRIRWLTKHEASRLILHSPEHLKGMIRLSLATGLRHRNVTQLKWSQIDMQRKVAWIYADEAKGKKAFSVPLNSEAIDVLRQQIGKHDEFVFTYKGNPVKDANKRAFKNALKKAGIDNFRWHDLRHTWASWHVQAGTSLYTLQTLGGWQSIEMVQRYAHLSSDELAKDAERITSYGTFTSQSKISAVS